MTTPDKLAPAALWHSIAETLTAEIASGQYRPGDRLPSEADLARRFGVHRHTLRRAMAKLAEGGLVHSRRGAGVFVAARPADYALGRRVRFHRNIAATGRIPGRQLLALETRRANATEAAALGLAPGDMVHAYGGVSLADAEPIALFLSVFPASALPGLPEALRADRSITAALAACGVTDHLRARTRISAALATPVQAAQLHLAAGAPLLRTEALNTDAGGRPVEYGLTWFAGERVSLTLESADR
ncbi:MAG: phosphonate metabolism transcriptional regulator PhnF [Limimaricola sp.]|uniref:phosphonate metabolism transcriptional regulator PhnF n=1 Tax=Limimaricola sp. TaxID=2211665 RepID=UPI001D6FF30C|nr:phosphonate metabolism transcriptional regulator PhnF [Limimaricola sp.]MBI1416448.1 phosphonate metabolism transcriptional regulator PhnF [Limimaricola sp.]